MSSNKTTAGLSFTFGNAKLSNRIAIFSLPTGHTCPGAKNCLAKVIVDDEGKPKIWDGPNQDYRCYSATAELVFKSVRVSRHNNLNLLREARTEEGMFNLLLRAIGGLTPRHVDFIRLHGGGDFFNEAYFRAWLGVMRARPDLKFYFYTKSLRILRKVLGDGATLLPDNVSGNISMGGKYDDMADLLALRKVFVVDHPDKAAEKGLEVDHNDSHAYASGREGDFALVLHGMQKSGTKASEALKTMREQNIEFSYGRRIAK